MKILPGLVALVTVASGSAAASYVDDQGELNLAISQLHSAIGKQPRVYKMWIQPGEVIVDAPDPTNVQNLKEWRFVRILGVIPWVFGPEETGKQPDPNVEAKLFDLDAIAFSEMPKLEKAAIKRAAIPDGVVKQIAIGRTIPLAGQSIAGDIFVSLDIEGARERADVNANAQCVILGGDFSETQHAKTLNLFKEPDLIAEAAAAFGDQVSKDPVLTQVWVDARNVTFETNISTEELKKQLGAGATYAFPWNLNGLDRRISSEAIERFRQGQTAAIPAKPLFNIGDVDWTIIAKLEADSLAKIGIPNAQVTGLILMKLNPGGKNTAVLTWIVSVKAPNSEVTDVLADVKGVIETVLPPSALPQAHR